MAFLPDVLGVELPIIQAPMAGVQGSALAIAVAHAGGLGSLPCAMLTPDTIRDEIAVIRTATEKPINLNFFCHEPPRFDEQREIAWRATLAPYYAELGIDATAVANGPTRAPYDTKLAELMTELRPAVVSFHFGLPSAPLLEATRQSGARILASATTLEEARWLDAQGVDAIIAQGAEAGGHRGMFMTDDVTTQLGTFALVPQVVKAVRVPVVAAGAIADARGVAAAMALGASAVQVGTAYLLCPESTTSAVHRSALSSDDARHTALTNLFSGRPARGIVNRVMRELGAMSSAPPAFPLAASAMAPLRAAAERDGRGDFSPLWAGENVSGCRAAPAAEITRALMGVL